MTVITTVAPQKEKEPNTVSDKSNDVLLKTPGGPTLARVIAPKHRFSPACRRALICLLVMCIALFIGSLIVGLVVYRNMYSADHPRRVTCTVQYPPSSTASRIRRSFEEEVEVHPHQEWLKVPQRRARRQFVWVIFLFNERRTILKLRNVCLIKPMRPDLYNPRNPEELMRRLITGRMHPFARNRREDWQIDGPPIPPRFLSNFMSGPTLEICRGLPVYHLVPAGIKAVLDRPFLHKPCPLRKCIACPNGMHNMKDQNGCQTCHCADQNNFCQFASPCALRCPNGFYKNKRIGCNHCRCQESHPFFRREKRSVSATTGEKTKEVCPIADVTFEGLPIIDENQKEGIMVTDFIRTCDSTVRDLLKE